MFLKVEVAYTPKAPDPGERCERCRHFEEPDGCEWVKGVISPKGWCKKWEKKR